jgi:hypothetical protein
MMVPTACSHWKSPSVSGLPIEGWSLWERWSWWVSYWWTLEWARSAADRWKMWMHPTWIHRRIAGCLLKRSSIEGYRTASEEAIGCEATRERSRSRKIDQPFRWGGVRLLGEDTQHTLRISFSLLIASVPMRCRTEGSSTRQSNPALNVPSIALQTITVNALNVSLHYNVAK